MHGKAIPCPDQGTKALPSFEPNEQAQAWHDEFESREHQDRLGYGLLSIGQSWFTTKPSPCVDAAAQVRPPVRREEGCLQPVCYHFVS